MKFLPIKLAILLTSVIALPSFATTQISSLDWNETQIKGGKATGGVVYKGAYSNHEKLFYAEIGHSTYGEQRIYLTNGYLSEKDICKFTYMSNNITMNFNGQAVKMFRWCKKSSNSNQNYYQYTPQTKRGDAYLVNLFKQSKQPVKVQFDDETLYIPVKGFTRVWNSAGGNAI